VKRALDLGWPHEEINRMTGIDPWFLEQIQQIVDLEREIGPGMDDETLRQAKRYGFSDARIAQLLGKGTREADVRARRLGAGIVPVYKRVDTCSAEFESHTPYLYSTYESENEAEPTAKKKVMILGSGPNRIGQGIEFDYCCCHASFAFREEGYETIMVNCNPETVSTDYDTSDRLYFEPLTFEDVMNIVELEKPEGVVIQFGGQTPLKLALPVASRGREDPRHQPRRHRPGRGPEALQRAAARAGHPAAGERDRHLAAGGQGRGPAHRLPGPHPAVLRAGRPRHGHRLRRGQAGGLRARGRLASPEHPILVDRFLEDAFEVDVDAVADGQRVVIGGILQHIEEAGVHSGDSAMVLPTYKITAPHLETIRSHTRRMGLALDVRGLMNVQYAIKDDVVYVLEVNPRASRTTPFVSKATGVPLAKVAARVMAGRSLAEQGITEDLAVDRIFVKESVFPFLKLAGSDILLGPEMKSTGEVMGISRNFGMAFAKSQSAAGFTIPTEGRSSSA
jgi:carbamoyl-phosphate synthase large subunit